ncbi:MAG: GAF domain-containing protein [Anaerolineales bacterium]
MFHTPQPPIFELFFTELRKSYFIAFQVKPTEKSPQIYFRILAAITTIILLGASATRFSPSAEMLLAGAISVLFIAFLVNFPLLVLGREITLVQVIALGAGLIYGPTIAIWGIALGFLAGAIIPRTLSSKSLPRSSFHNLSWLEITASTGFQSLSLALSFLAFRWDTGIAQNPARLELGGIIALATTFSVVHTLFFLADLWLHQRHNPLNPRRDVVSLTLVEILPLPFILIAALAYPSIKIGSLAALGGVPSILAILMHGMSIARSDLERRLQDLSTIDNISRTLRSTLDMERLLKTLQPQITQSLGIDSFYVALYDADDKQIWYPLAVKHGERQDWSRRPLADRLTDRVILARKPILLPRRAQDELAKIGLPPGEGALNAWLGVPLITPERIIGCLAVLSVSPKAEFTKADLNLLTILSGQVSVAIENALLYEQAQRRAVQLENLNQVSTLITASLNLDEVLAKVCKSVIQVGGGQQSAIFLLDQDEGKVRMAHSQGLSVEFAEKNQSFSAAHNVRARCMRTGNPFLAENVHEADLGDEFRTSLSEENIRAFGDFPLITPDGQIGFLTVYFNTPLIFPTKQVELLQTFASQAALAVSNARLHAQTDEALTRRAYQLAILEAVGREISAVTYSEHLFQMILDYALEFTNASWGGLVLYDAQSNTLEFKASVGYSLTQTRQPSNYGIANRVILTGSPVLIPNVSEISDFVDLTGGKTRSQLSVPLINEGRVLGIISLESPEPNAFDTNDQAFISQLANQASIAVINAKLYLETQRRLREQSSLYLVSSRLVGNLRLESVAHTVGQAIGAAMNASLAGVYLWDAGKDAYTLRTQIQTSYLPTHNTLPEMISGGRLRADYPAMQNTNTLKVYQTKEQLIRHLNTCKGCRALILPLTITHEHFGIVVLHVDHERGFSEEDLQLPHAMAAQGSIAIQNALLFADVTQGRDRLAAVLNSVGEGIMMIDAAGQITLVNEPIETLTNTSASVLVGIHLRSLSEKALTNLGLTHSQVQDILTALARGLAPATTKTIVKRTDTGSEKVFECTTAPVWGRANRVVGLIIVIRDITEEHEIAQARELITHTLVHDLKSPMSAITSALALIDEIISETPIDYDIIEQSLAIAERASQRILTLVEALLDIAKMESGQMGLNLERVNLSMLLSQISKDFSPQARSSGVILKMNTIPRLPTFRIDRDKIIRVLVNLLDNALKFTPTGGQITLSAHQDAANLVNVQVIDSGPGIPGEYREKIFDRFSQVPGIRGRRRGSGLGLTFCRLVVEAHGGHIWVEPNPEGGSIFHFTLPLHPSLPHPLSPSLTPQP